jgi:hypothetical protein
MNKRGQFYIIAAIIILLAVAGIIGVKTYTSTTPKPRTIQNMGDELKKESFRIVDYGIYNGKNTNELLDKFTENYSSYFLQKTNNANVIFVYGNNTDLYAVKYDSASTGSVSADIGGGGAAGWNTYTNFVNKTQIIIGSLPTGTSGNKKVNVTIFKKEYDFDLKNNQMFYFVIVQEKEGEVYVEKS